MLPTLQQQTLECEFHSIRTQATADW